MFDRFFFLNSNLNWNSIWFAHNSKWKSFFFILNKMYAEIEWWSFCTQTHINRFLTFCHTIEIHKSTKKKIPNQMLLLLCVVTALCEIETHTKKKNKIFAETQFEWWWSSRFGCIGKPHKKKIIRKNPFCFSYCTK